MSTYPASSGNAAKDRRALTAGSLILLGIGGSLMLRSWPAYVAGAALTTMGVVSAAKKGIRPDQAVNAYSNEVFDSITELFNPTTVENQSRRVVSAIAAQVPVLGKLQEQYTRMSEDPLFFNGLVTMDPASKRFDPLIVAGLPGEGKTRVSQRLVEQFTILNPEGEVLIFDPEYSFNQSDPNGTPWPEHLKLGTHIFEDLAGLNAIRQTLQKRLKSKGATTPLLIFFDELNNIRSFPGMPEEEEYYITFLKELKVAYNRAGKRGVMLVTGIQRIGAKETGLPIEYLSSFPWLVFPKLARSKRLQQVLGLEQEQKQLFQQTLAEVDEVTAMDNDQLHPMLYFTQEEIRCQLIPHFKEHEIVQVVEPGLDWLLKVWKACPEIIEAIESGQIKSRTELADPSKPYQEELAAALNETKLQRKNADHRWQSLATYWEQMTSGDFRAAITAADNS
ncbi:hypothetical protein N836_00275 [Leptolyngbya sp. Heron Island J]|nr:hypothetical protein N836_00275 [Leptolyngbya sp. Heron Island J]